MRNIRNYNDNLGCCFFAMSFQVPANKIGFNGGPFSLLELKVIQEIIPYLFCDLLHFF
jgi:uncharacterized protein (DUF486 family)